MKSSSVKFLIFITSLLVAACEGKDEKKNSQEISLVCGSIPDGNTTELTLYSAQEVPFGKSCDSVKETRIAVCQNGELKLENPFSIEATHKDCVVEEPKSCGNDDDGFVQHAKILALKRYSSSEVPFGESCDSVAFEVKALCDNGTYKLETTDGFAECAPKAPLNCGDLEHGKQAAFTRYRASMVPFGQSCADVKETVTGSCYNGTINYSAPFSDAAVHTSCVSQEAKRCGNEVDGFTDHGGQKKITRYSRSEVEFGQSCSAVAVEVTATCKDGTYQFEAPGTFSECAPKQPQNCGDLKHGESQNRIRYLTPTVPAGQSCDAVKEEQSGTCYNGNLKFTGEAKYEECRPESAGQRKVEAFISPNSEAKSKLMAALENANKSIFVSMYSMSDTSLRNILVKKAQEGVKVFIVFNKGQCDGLSRKSCEDIEANGGNIRFFSKTNHEKFAVIDHEFLGQTPPGRFPLAVSGSGNWSGSSFTRYDDDVIFFHGEDDIKDLLAEFDIIWENSKAWEKEDNKIQIQIDRGRQPSGFNLFTSGNFSFSGRGISLRPEVAGDPSNGVVQSKMVEFIDAAKKSIKIATAHFRLKSVYDAVVRARGRGVEVRVVIDQQEFQSNSTSGCESVSDPKKLDECLATLGFDVRWKTYMARWDHAKAAQMHLKYIIIDEMYVLSGSFNFSETAETSNLETLHILEGQPIVEAYSKNFEKVSAYGGKEQLSDLLKRAANGEIICNWQALTLNMAEYSNLRATIFSPPGAFEKCAP